jgi:hypothetical protein
MPPVKPCRKETNFEAITRSPEILAREIGNYVYTHNGQPLTGLTSFVGNFGYWLKEESKG